MGRLHLNPLVLLLQMICYMCICAKENNLLDQDNWNRFKDIAKCEKKLLQMANQAKLCSYCTAPNYKYGYEVPNDFRHAVQIDEKCGNTKW